ncbi:MAG: antibiotic biosynthesis monooxygenase [Anaerolineae bacterium]|nr:antibiotic biosynthesis monooxygenase [Anaerolineae bacterium]
MAYLFIRHTVKDYPAWKAAFDSFIEMRRASGEKWYQIFHPTDDPNSLFLLFRWDTLTNVRTFMSNPELKKVMGTAEFTEAPEVPFFLKKYAQGKLS